MADDLTDRITLQGGMVRFESDGGPLTIAAEMIFAAHKMLVDVAAPKATYPWWLRWIAFGPSTEEAWRDEYALERWQREGLEKKLHDAETANACNSDYYHTVTTILRRENAALREQLARLTGDMDDDTAARAALGDTDGR